MSGILARFRGMRKIFSEIWNFGEAEYAAVRAKNDEARRQLDDIQRKIKELDDDWGKKREEAALYAIRLNEAAKKQTAQQHKDAQARILEAFEQTERAHARALDNHLKKHALEAKDYPAVSKKPVE